MGHLSKKLVIRISRRQLDVIINESIAQKKPISQIVRKAIKEYLAS
jgi:predicted HicB family RNase H-like nuclease